LVRSIFNELSVSTQKPETNCFCFAKPPSLEGPLIPRFFHHAHCRRNHTIWQGLSWWGSAQAFDEARWTCATDIWGTHVRNFGQGINPGPDARIRMCATVTLLISVVMCQGSFEGHIGTLLMAKRITTPGLFSVRLSARLKKQSLLQKHFLTPEGNCEHVSWRSACAHRTIHTEY